MTNTQLQAICDKLEALADKAETQAESCGDSDAQQEKAELLTAQVDACREAIDTLQAVME